MDADIPPALANRYDKLTTELIASRLRWLSPILIGVLVFDGVLDALDPNLTAGRIAILMSVRVVAISILLLIRYFSTRAAQIGFLRLLGYVCTIVFYISALAFQLVYPKQLTVGVAFYIIVMFLSCFLLPWRVKDSMAIAVMGAAAYSVEALKSAEFFDFEQYSTNLFCFLIGGFLMVIMKRDDERRRRHEFLLQAQVEEKNAELERDLDLARRIHLSLIPKSVALEDADVAVTYAPMSYVGGDYANFLMGGDGRLVFFMSDIAGHGVPAALVVNRIHSEVVRLMKEPIGPGEFLHELDVFVTQQLEATSMFLSAFSGVLDFRRKNLSTPTTDTLRRSSIKAAREKSISWNPGLPFLG